MARVTAAVMQARRQAIVYALYAMDGNFTINQLAEAAGGAYLRRQAADVVRERVARGSVLVVAETVVPHLYRLAPDV